MQQYFLLWSFKPKEIREQLQKKKNQKTKFRRDKVAVIEDDIIRGRIRDIFWISFPNSRRCKYSVDEKQCGEDCEVTEGRVSKGIPRDGFIGSKSCKRARIARFTGRAPNSLFSLLVVVVVGGKARRLSLNPGWSPTL